jgi:protein phosphatase-4 regulatory subunit 3
MVEASQPLILPEPDMGSLPEIENTIRMANVTNHGREALAKYVMANDYIAKLVPLVDVAEDFESLPDLHRLCNIMKTIILLNDNAIIELVVKDEMILGVVGALECALAVSLAATTS